MLVPVRNDSAASFPALCVTCSTVTEQRTIYSYIKELERRVLKFLNYLSIAIIEIWGIHLTKVDFVRTYIYFQDFVDKF